MNWNYVVFLLTANAAGYSLAKSISKFLNVYVKVAEDS